MKKIIRYAVMLLTIFSLSVSFVPGNVENKAQAASSKKYERVLLVGESIKLKSSKKVKWTSSNKKVATVSSKGVVRGKSKGKAVITGTVGKKKIKVNVKVEQPVLSNIKLELLEGDSVKIKVSGTTKPVVWSSSDESKATVNDGMITAISEGNVTITAKVSKQKLYCNVKVMAAIGKINNPIDAFEEFETPVYEGKERMGVFRIKLAEYKQGDDVIRLLEDLHNDYTKPDSNQEYVFFKFVIEYRNGIYDASAKKIINLKDNLYSSNSKELVENIACVNGVASKDIDDVLLYPNGKTTCTKTILINKNMTPLLYKIQTGYDEAKLEPVYTWFKVK